MTTKHTSVVARWALVGLLAIGLSAHLLLIAYFSKDLASFLFPTVGIVASLHGFFRKDQLGALVLGVVPYAPLLFSGFPPSVLLLLGVPMGLMGMGSALLRHKPPTNFAGFALLFIGIVMWSLAASTLKPS